jgi:hypothetical protein
MLPSARTKGNRLYISVARRLVTIALKTLNTLKPLLGHLQYSLWQFNLEKVRLGTTRRTCVEWGGWVGAPRYRRLLKSLRSQMVQIPQKSL